MKRECFNIDKFNIIEDEDNYYFFRALNNADQNDIKNNITSNESGIQRIRTDRERFEETYGTAKYNSKSEISLEEVWDHIKIRYIKETNCISLSSNANVSIDYGQMYNEEYAMVKVPKTGNDKVYNAGQYMLEEVNKKVEEAISRLPKDSDVLDIIKRIDEENSYKNVTGIVSEAYKGIKNIDGKYKGYNNIKSKETVASRFKKRQYFSDEQQLEYNKVIAKLTVLEACGKLRSILPTKEDNSSLIATIGLAFSSGELIHYKDIHSDDMVKVPKELMDLLSFVQQIKEKGLNDSAIKSIEKKIIGFINDGYELKTEGEKSVLTNGKEKIELNTHIGEEKQLENEITVEEVYNATQGRINYEKAKIAVKFLTKLSQSRIKASGYANLIQALGSEYNEIAKKVESECFAVDKDIISREDNIGKKIAESVNIGLTREERSFVSNTEQLKLIDSIKKLNLEELKKVINTAELNEKLNLLQNILDKKEVTSENEYYAEAIVDGLDLQKIYKSISNEKRIMTEDEKTTLINKLISSNCKKLYNSFKSIGAKSSEISGFIVSLLLNGGYKGYSLEELSNLENLDEIISTNVKNNNIRNSISALKLDEALGIKDDSYEVGDTDIVLRDYQKETLDNIDRIFENKRFAGMILPTGAGKSFVAMAEMMKFKGKNIIFVAPQNTILHQFEVHILKNILHKKIITDEELKELEKNGEPIPKNVIKPKDFKKVLQQEFPSLKMFCYDGITAKSEEWLEARDADLIILDELHRSGAKTWEPQIKKLIELNPKAKILGMTATPIRDVDGKDMARGLAEMTKDYTEEELINKEYLASEMHLLDAMQEDYLVSPKIVTFDYTLADSDEYHEITEMIESEKDNEKLKELIKIKNDMDSIIKKSSKEGMSGIFSKNIQKKNGKYIIFLPQNPDSKIVSSEEYMESEIEKIKEYFKAVNPNIKTSYLLSDRKNAKIENSKALDEFENSNSEDLHLLFAVNMLNEGVHVDGIDGVVMMRPISENSKILYLQQIGRCIFSEDPNNPIKEEDKPVIFDVYNNYLAQNMDREANKTNSTSDLQKLKILISWIEKHKGYIPDINSEDIKEAKKAVTLKNIQKKYKKYLDGIKNKNLSESEVYEIHSIIQLGKSIELWDLEIPDRIIPPGEREITKNDTFKVTGTQREFLELFKRANKLIRGKRSNNMIRLKSILSLMDVLSEHGIEINNNMISYESKLKDIINSLPNDIKDNIQKDIEDLYFSFDEEYPIGEEYDFAKRSFCGGEKIFTQYDIKDLRRYGIFEGGMCTNERGFIIYGPEEYIGLNIHTGTKYDERGLDTRGMDMYGLYAHQIVDKHNFSLRNGNYYEKDENGEWIDTGSKINPNGLDKNGDYWQENENGELINTYSKFGKDGYSLFGINEYGFSKENKKFYGVVKNTGKPQNTWYSHRDKLGFDFNGINEFGFERNGNYYEEDENGEWIDTGSKINLNGLDKNGDYWQENENGELINTHSKFGKDGYSLYGINEYGFSKKDKKFYGVVKSTGKPENEVGTYRDKLGFNFNGINGFSFGRNGNYYEKNENGEWVDTESKVNLNGLDKNGDYWQENENGELINTYSKFGKDGYSLFGINKYGFSKKDKKFHDVNEKNGRPVNKTGTDRDKSGFDFNGINEFGFGRNGNYYEKDENGEWIDTGSKINLNGLDKNGDYWQENENGELINTHSKFGKDGYSLYGINEYGFSKEDKKFYSVVKSTGKRRNERGRTRDYEGYDFDGLNSNGRGRDGRYYEKLEDGKLKDITFQKFSHEDDNGLAINQFNFGKNGNYYVHDKDGIWIDTGSKLNPNGLDINGDYWQENENGELINTYSKFGKDGYSLYRINKLGFSIEDKLWYGVNEDTGEPIFKFGRRFDDNNLDFDRYDLEGYHGVFKINRDQFDRDGYYYKKQEDGTYVNTRLKYNKFGFEANRRHKITRSAIDLRHFDINGVCKSNNDSIYDEKGFKQDGTYMETGEKYHNGYNAFGVNEEGKMPNGREPKEITFTKEYVSAVLIGKRAEILRKYGLDNVESAKTDIMVYKATQMFPKLEKTIKAKVFMMEKQIEARDKKIKELEKGIITAKEKLEIEKLKREKETIRQRMSYIDPTQEIEK